MENEYQILAHLQDNEETSQRKISQRTGLSLGAVNILIKKMVRKGLIKVETLNSRTMRYILTPKGLQEKANLTYNYLRQSYRQLLRINQALDQLIIERVPSINGKPIALVGPTDEICEILTQFLHEKSIPYELVTDRKMMPPKMSETVGEIEYPLIITWREEEEQTLANHPNSINVMKLL